MDVKCALYDLCKFFLISPILIEQKDEKTTLTIVVLCPRNLTTIDYVTDIRELNKIVHTAAVDVNSQNECSSDLPDVRSTAQILFCFVFHGYGSPTRIYVARLADG